MWLIFLLNAVCGSTFALNKMLLEYTGPFLLVALRMIIAGALLYGYYYWTNPKAAKITKDDIWPLVQISFLGIFISFMLELWAQQYVSAGKTAFIFNLTPFITALFSYFAFNEKMTFKKLLGLTIGFIGFFPILLVNPQAENVDGLFGNFLSMPELALILAVITYAYTWVLMRKLVRNDASPFMVNGVTMFFGGLMAIPATVLFEGAPHITAWGTFFGLLALLILMGNVIFYNLYGFLLKRYTATFLSFTGFTIPFFSAIFGWFLLGETVGWDFYVSSIIVFIGLYIFYQEELRQGYIQKGV